MPLAPINCRLHCAQIKIIFKKKLSAFHYWAFKFENVNSLFGRIYSYVRQRSTAHQKIDYARLLLTMRMMTSLIYSYSHSDGKLRSILLLIMCVLKQIFVSIAVWANDVEIRIIIVMKGKYWRWVFCIFITVNQLKDFYANFSADDDVIIHTHSHERSWVV